MTQSSAQTWCNQVQARLMAALDAIWASVEGVDDPVLLRKARDKAKLCGEMAATVRKIAAMSPVRKPSPAFPGLPDGFDPEPRPGRAIDRLKGGGRGRL